VLTVFLQGPSGHTAEDELLVQVQGMIAEYERAKILERSRRGKLHRARQGSVNVLGGAPYGYVYVKKAEQQPASYRILLHEAKIVRQIFRSLVQTQKSLRQIGRDLDAAEVETRCAGTLRRSVTSPRIQRMLARRPLARQRLLKATRRCAQGVEFVVHQKKASLNARDPKPSGLALTFPPSCRTTCLMRHRNSSH
jgi:site-specific DNA recombinase